MVCRRLAWILTLTVSSIAHAAAPSCGATQILGWNFDWDDNIFNMPTKIFVRNKTTGAEKAVTTAEWALIREQIGKPGAWADYAFTPATSLRDFGDESGDGVNHFKADVEAALKKSKTAWQAHSWKAFTEAMAHERNAAWTTIITARQHAPATIHDALEALRAKGYLKHVPPTENIYPVSYPKFDAALRGDGQNPSAAKARVMERILDRIQQHALGADAKPVLNANGTGPQPLHLWGFSDDDYGNYSKAVSALSGDIRANPKRWDRIKITLFFTGKNHPTEKPRTEVIRADGALRPIKEGELNEAMAIVRAGPPECQN